MKKYLPWALLGVMAVWALSALRPMSAWNGFDLAGFGRLPVLLNGRVQPLDSVARNSLLQLRTKQSIRHPDGKMVPATAWLSTLLLNPAGTDNWQAFRVDHPEVLSLMKLSQEEKYFSYAELKPNFPELDKNARQASNKDNSQRSAFERAVLRLHNALGLYQRLRNSLQNEECKDFEADLKSYVAATGPGTEAFRNQQAGKPFDQAALNKFTGLMQGFDTVSRLAYPLMIPPLHPEQSRDNWVNAGDAAMHGMHDQGENLSPSLLWYARMSSAMRQNRPADFNAAVTEYTQWLNQNFAPEFAKSRHEFIFNSSETFYRSSAIYLLAFLCACFSLLNLTEWLRKSAFNLMVLGLVLHTLGLVYRMVLEGRPPVTNLYSSAIFIGWAAVGLGVFLERMFPLGLGSLTGSITGFVTLIIAHNLALGGDTMEMMRAVLDSNFWLATHVVVVTLGYSATYMAGLLGLLYIFLGVFTRNLTSAMGEALSRMVYGITCFATLFSFVGTVLGGIWADQSWGRFWGWDPKENGALIIVLWTALYLHAHWGGLLKEKGLMCLAVAGNMVTSWSWFGVNMLGVGLHSYGFMDSGFPWLMLFAATQVGFILLGNLPLKLWRSRETLTATDTAD
jgi:ABC-type transport system involved in cytochrome c biogenesis permease subunit